MNAQETQNPSWNLNKRPLFHQQSLIILKDSSMHSAGDLE
jgi:hypothetical protein